MHAIPPSPAVSIGQHYKRAGVVVNCAVIERPRDYDCRVLVINKKSHSCRRMLVHWDGEHWVVRTNTRNDCPYPLIRTGNGSLHALKA